ncbi:MAG: hypothetical protein HYX92_03825 [Chloroflexi bacterium]|nr:hypothetical protein [Chloroflexota bacterium]
MTTASHDGKALSAESDSSSATQPPGGQWIDISVPLRSGMAHWPGNPGMPFDAAIGPAWVIQINDSESMKPGIPFQQQDPQRDPVKC